MKHLFTIRLRAVALLALTVLVVTTRPSWAQGGPPPAIIHTVPAVSCNSAKEVTSGTRVGMSATVQSQGLAVQSDTCTKVVVLVEGVIAQAKYPNGSDQATISSPYDFGSGDNAVRQWQVTAYGWTSIYHKGDTVTVGLSASGAYLYYIPWNVSGNAPFKVEIL